MPLKPEMKVREFEVFRGMYCGLCHTLRSCYGMGTENILSYDLCFLAILLSQANGCEIERCERCCISSPIRKKSCVAENEALRYAADATVILSYFRTLDGIRDEGFFKATACRLAKAFLKPKYIKAAQALPAFNATVDACLRELALLEDSGCKSIDMTADTFARILRSLSDGVYDDAFRRVVGEILYHVGRWIYIVDAWDDLDSDVNSGKYNPVFSRYFPNHQKQEVKAELRNTLYKSLDTAANSAQLLPDGRFMPIIENILCQGLPNVTERVLEGKFKTKKFFRGRTEDGSI